MKTFCLRSFSPIRSGFSLLVTAIIVMGLAVASCAATPESSSITSTRELGASGGSSHEMLNAVLWQATSAEYEAVALQTYALASRNLDIALADPTWTAALEQTVSFEKLPTAVILDLDETVLDNSAYNVDVVSRLGEFSKRSFRDWCLEVEAPAVPGARAFLADAIRKKVAVFYVSARTEDLRTCTVENLKRLGMPIADEEDSILLDVGHSKSDERGLLAQRYRILLLIGDNLDDFVDGSRASPEQRSVLAKRFAKRWGYTWIVLPNPMYGHWEDAFHGFSYDLSRDAKLQSKHHGLTAGLKN